MSEMAWRKMRNYMAMLEEMTGGPPEAELCRKELARVCVRDAKAIAGATPADVGEGPNSYVFIVDMPGVKASAGEIKVEVEENGNVLMVSGERKRCKDHNKESKGDRIKYRKMERIRKFARKFGLPENANVDAISALYEDGVLTVTVQKLPPPQPKRPKTIEVKVA